MNRYDEMKDQCKMFHVEHPEVWGLFVRCTFEMIRVGRSHYSARTVWERIRWETDQAQTSDAEFKLNNNHHPFYARAFMKKYPEHDGFFRLRKQTSKEHLPCHLAPLTPQDYDLPEYLRYGT